MAAIWICPAAWAAWEVENKMVLMITKPALQKAGFFMCNVLKLIISLL